MSFHVLETPWCPISFHFPVLLSGYPPGAPNMQQPMRPAGEPPQWQGQPRPQGPPGYQQIQPHPGNPMQYPAPSMSGRQWHWQYQH